MLSGGGWTDGLPYERACAWLADRYPMIASGLLPNVDGSPATRALAERVLELYRTKAGREDVDLARGLEAFARISFDFIRLQARFTKTGVYRSSEARKIVEELYLDAGRMEGYYLDGLLLTYAFWPNHAKMLRFLCEEFLPSLGPAPRVLELGVGHGLMAYLTLSERDDTRYAGVDLSPSSLRYADELLRRSGVEQERFELCRGDAAKSTGISAAEGEPFDACLCCEVLEHVEVPGRVLARMGSLLAPGGRAYVTTVANIEAEDHIFLFHDAHHIRRSLEEEGFRIERDLVLPLHGMEGRSPEPINYAAVLRFAG